MPFPWQNVWLPFTALAGVVSGTLLTGGFVGRGAARQHGAGGDAEMPPPRTLPPSTDAPLRLTSEQLDAEREVVAAVQEYAGFAADRFVQLDTAIQPGLTVWADKNALRQIVAAPLRTAVERGAGGRVLVGAGRHGGRVRISVSDDGAPGDRAVQEAQLRDVTHLVALQGGTLEVNVRANAGTTVVIRLPEPAAAPASAVVPVHASAPQPAFQDAASATVE